MITPQVFFFIIGFAFVIFSLLDGFDMGVAMLLPFFLKSPDTRRKAVDSIWPVWDGNELWGLAGAGALLVVFPKVFTSVLNGMYPVVVLLLIAAVFRPVIFELRYHSAENEKLWDNIFALTGFILAFIIGTVFGNTIYGYNVLPDGTVAGGLFSIFNPFALLTGLLFVAMFLVQGASWLILKLEGRDHEEAFAVIKKLWYIPPVLFAGWGLWAQSFTGAAQRPLFWMFFGLFIAVNVIMGILIIKRKSDTVILISSVLSIIFFWCTTAAVQFPVLIRSGIAGTADITVQNAGAMQITAGILSWIVPAVMAVVVFYSIFVYRMFKGKVNKN